MRVLRRADYETRPWRNGGGISHEVAWHADDDWRLSLAEITKDGAFSDYAGFDRTLTVIGDGLRFDGAPIGPAPHSFRGEDSINATLHAGPVLAFNVITRRGAMAHAVTRRTDAAESTATFVFILRGTARIGEHTLHALDAAALERSPARILPESGTEWAEVTLRPA